MSKAETHIQVFVHEGKIILSLSSNLGGYGRGNDTTAIHMDEVEAEALKHQIDYALEVIKNGKF